MYGTLGVFSYPASQATATGALIALVVGLGVSAGLLEYGQTLLHLFIGGNDAGEGGILKG